jgi:hypothetical protein
VFADRRLAVGGGLVDWGHYGASRGVWCLSGMDGQRFEAQIISHCALRAGILVQPAPAGQSGFT